MDQLWAPWRFAYVAKETPPEAGDECFICRGQNASDDRANLLLQRTPLSTVLLNKFPYNNGHLLVAPKAHKGRLDELTAEESLDLQNGLVRMMRLMEQTMRPDGFNVGLNLGKVAGAGLPGHLHWHIVPRWNGDTNFMPVFGDVRVISQSLDALYDLLSAALARE
ncbi:MAG: HIT domain-containing protein [Gemmataceae bacterium]|nr:HIT domain-containing protein [Gemmataceae bacterium]